MPVSAIILAAGLSSRMGRQKALLPYRGRTIIEQIVGEVNAAGVLETLVVTGHEPEAVEAVLAGTDARLVWNPHFEQGMLSSVRTGLAACDTRAEWALICLGDQPAIAASTIARLIAAQHQSGKSICMPIHKGKRGHPLLISMQYKAEILREYDAIGLRGLAQAHPGEVLEVPMDVPGVLVDVDTPEDYARLQREN